MKENRLINDQIRKALQTDVGLCISIHGPAHLGLRRPTGRQCWVHACAICGDDKSTLHLLAKKEMLRKKLLDWTLPLLMCNPTLPQLWSSAAELLSCTAAVMHGGHYARRLRCTAAMVHGGHDARRPWCSGHDARRNTESRPAAAVHRSRPPPPPH